MLLGRAMYMGWEACTHSSFCWWCKRSMQKLYLMGGWISHQRHSGVSWITLPSAPSNFMDLPLQQVHTNNRGSILLQRACFGLCVTETGKSSSRRHLTGCKFFRLHGKVKRAWDSMNCKRRASNGLFHKLFWQALHLQLHMLVSFGVWHKFPTKCSILKSLWCGNTTRTDILLVELANL